MANKLTRAVVVGCGGFSDTTWFTPWREHLTDRLQIVGLVDPEQACLDRKKASHALTDVPGAADLDEMLDRVEPDVVFNSTPPAVHRATTIAALQHGCHVLCQKPMASTLVEAQEMIDVARAMDRRLMITQFARYASSAHRMQRFLASGALGELSAIHADFFMGAHFGGFRAQMPHVLLLDLAVHTFDLVRFLVGADPTSVFCREDNPPGSWFADGATAMAVFEFPGIVFTYRGSWCSKGNPTPWGGLWRFMFSEGSVVWDGEDEITAEREEASNALIRGSVGVSVPEGAVLEQEGFAGIISEFLDGVETGAPMSTEGTDNIKSLAMTLSAIESAGKGEVVPVRL